MLVMLLAQGTITNHSGARNRACFTKYKYESRFDQMWYKTYEEMTVFIDLPLVDKAAYTVEQCIAKKVHVSWYTNVL